MPCDLESDWVGAVVVGDEHFRSIWVAERDVVRSNYASNATINYGVTPGLDNVALRNPDGSKVLVAYNNSPHPIRFQVAWRGRAFTYTLGARGTVTFTWR